MLTEAEIRKAIRKGGQKTLADGRGKGAGRLLLRIRPSSTPEWYAQQWTGDKRRLQKIGSYPSMTLADARETFATRFLSSIRSGEDIRRKPTRAAGTVKELFLDYISHLEAKNARSAENVGHTLARLAEAIGPNKEARAVTTRDVVEALRPVYERGHASMADHMRGYVRSAYGWAIRSQNDYRAAAGAKYGLSENPAMNIPTEPKHPGERWLSVQELQLFWNWIENGGTRHENRNTAAANYQAIKLIMATGQRTEEIARLSASMVNRAIGCIEWPKTKNGKAHALPMSETVLDILDDLRPNEHGLYFPSEVFPNRNVTDQTLRMICVRYCRETGAAYFTPRDLRRTWKTLAGFAGVSRSDRDLLQNHARSDVGSVHYDRYDYLTEKRAAVKVWDRWFRVRVGLSPHAAE
jgi:integrase